MSSAETLKGTLFWILALILSILTLSWLVWLECRPEPTPWGFAVAGDVDSLRKSISSRTDLNVRNSEGLTLLACAVRAGHEDITTFLLQAGADINGLSEGRLTPLHYALQQDNVQMISDFLEAGADPYLTDENGVCPFYLAVKKNHPSVPVFLEKEVEPDDTHAPKQMGYLFCAAQSGCVPILEYMLPYESNVNRLSGRGVTALLYAVNAGRADIARLLIEHGADVNATDRQSLAPLHHAVLVRNTELIHLLLEHGADLEAQNKDGHTPLLLAAQKGWVKAFGVLLDSGADPSAKDHKMLDAEKLAPEQEKREISELMRRHRQVTAECEAGATILF